MKKFIISILIFFMSINLSYAALKGDFDWQNIKTEPFEAINFGETTYKQFKKQYKFFKKNTVTNEEIILSNKSPKSPYSEIRAGFKDHKLDWIEFIFEEEGDLNDFMSLYGTPENINKVHSEFYNYYNYGYFNISTDKKEKHFYSLTLFELPKLDKKYEDIDKKLPTYNNLNFSKVFIPGQYLEMDFAEDYPDLFPKFDKNGTKRYIIKSNILKNYNKAELVFSNGLLNFISLYPKNLKLGEIVEHYGMVEKVYTKKDKIIYDYKTFTIITDTKDNIINIGLFSTL